VSPKLDIACVWLRETMSNPIVFARMPKRHVELLKRVCEFRGEDLSDFVRRAVKTELARLSYLSDDEKKALGITPERPKEVVG